MYRRKGYMLVDLGTVDELLPLVDCISSPLSLAKSAAFPHAVTDGNETVTCENATFQTYLGFIVRCYLAIPKRKFLGLLLSKP